MDGGVTGYSEFQFYSPVLDDNLVRLSMADDHGREFYVVLREGKAYRERRRAALEDIGEAIEAGLQPGRVLVSSPDQVEQED